MSDEPTKLRICRDCWWRDTSRAVGKPLRCLIPEEDAAFERVGDWLDSWWSYLTPEGEPGLGPTSATAPSCPGHSARPEPSPAPYRPGPAPYARWVVVEQRTDRPTLGFGEVVAIGLRYATAQAYARELPDRRRYLFRHADEPDPRHADRTGTYNEDLEVGDVVRVLGEQSTRSIRLEKFDPVADLRAALAAPSVFDDVPLDEE